MPNARIRFSNAPTTDKPDETVDASDWKSTLTYVLLAVQLLAIVFGVFYGVVALYYGE
ncbi:MAG TPA: hypothetical protein VG055_04415 [Planctomycetaceae bacterium]|jgi:hypothetical protein|nr:hypothetical protein [Planctomycetaceae bacterium]